MAAKISNFALLISAALLLLSLRCSASSPRKLALVQQPLTVLKYHNGPLLKGNYTINLLYYGRFYPSQRTVIADFIRSLSAPAPARSPSVSAWWATTSRYRAGPTHLSLGAQILDPSYSLGKSLTISQITSLSQNKLGPASGPTSITAVLTSADVAVEGFCSSRCGTHWSAPGSRTYIWSGNPSAQCPGQCAWPFHQPPYGPQTPPLVSPNGDVGVDGMIINLATVLAGTVTNPFGSGFYQGPASAPLEAVSACAGMFGSGSYPGYPGKVLVDPTTGASYNAQGLSGRKYLLPAMWDPKTSQCAALV